MPESHKCAEVETRYFKMGGLFLYGTGPRAAGSIFLSSQDSYMAWSKTKHYFSLFAAQHGYVLPQQTKKKSERET